MIWVMSMEDIKNRKTTRLQGYDYNKTGAFFLTVCTENRRCVLSKIVGTGVLDGPFTNGFAKPHIELLPYGKIADKYIKQLDAFYDDISVRSYVIMPNHIHILLSINRLAAGASPCPTLSDVICAFKSLTTRICRAGEIFQASFYDHIVRDNNDYLAVWQYIDNNPHKWELDKYYQS